MGTHNILIVGGPGVGKKTFIKAAVHFTNSADQNIESVNTCPNNLAYSPVEVVWGDYRLCLMHTTGSALKETWSKLFEPISAGENLHAICFLMKSASVEENGAHFHNFVNKFIIRFLDKNILNNVYFVFTHSEEKPIIFDETLIRFREICDERELKYTFNFVQEANFFWLDSDLSRIKENNSNWGDSFWKFIWRMAGRDSFEIIETLAFDTDWFRHYAHFIIKISELIDNETQMKNYGKNLEKLQKVRIQLLGSVNVPDLPLLLSPLRICTNCELKIETNSKSKVEHFKTCDAEFDTNRICADCECEEKKHVTVFKYNDLVKNYVVSEETKIKYLKRIKIAEELEQRIEEFRDISQKCREIQDAEVVLAAKCFLYWQSRSILPLEDKFEMCILSFLRRIKVGEILYKYKEAKLTASIEHYVGMIALEEHESNVKMFEQLSEVGYEALWFIKAQEDKFNVLDEILCDLQVTTAYDLVETLGKNFRKNQEKKSILNTCKCEEYQLLLKTIEIQKVDMQHKFDEMKTLIETLMTTKINETVIGAENNAPDDAQESFDDTASSHHHQND